MESSTHLKKTACPDRVIRGAKLLSHISRKKLQLVLIMKKILLFSLGMAVLSSCANTKKITKITDSKDPVMNQNVNGMVSRPLLADLSVENTRQEVTYSAKLNISEIDRKANAKQLFLETHNCDFIVDPIYTNTYTDVNGKTKEIQIKLTGLPAKYSKITQVDSLPKSIQQYHALMNPVERVIYVNSVDEGSPTVGVEINLGTKGQQGIQVDFLLKNEKARIYFSAENYNNANPDFKMNFEDSTGSLISTSGSSVGFGSLSLGLMKEKSVSNRVKFRGQGGLNLSSYSETGIQSGLGSIQSIYRLGFRLGIGADIRLYKNVSLILKAHSNIGVFNIYDKESIGNVSFKVKDFKMTGLPNYYLGYGLRFVF